MTDSIRIFEPGWRAIDAQGDTLSGAFIDFFLAETSTPDPAYADAGLTVSLGTTITCDSGGYPTSDGNAKTTIFRGTSEFRVRLRKADGTTVWDHDNQPGAPDLSAIAAQSGRVIGEMIDYAGTTAPSAEWLFLNQLTIGSSASGATARASDSPGTLALFTLLWNATTNTELVIQTSAGSNTTRGVSAASDFAANKRLPLPDFRGRTAAGADNMGATASQNRLVSGLTNGIDGDVPFAANGSDRHTLSEAQLPTITPAGTIESTSTVTSFLRRNAITLNVGAGPGNTVQQDQANTSFTIGSTFTGTPFGSDDAHNNVQPTIIVPSKLIYAGAP